MYSKFFKRVLDIVGSIIVLPFVGLVILFLAPIIWLTDRGPVFYIARRAGKDYKPFKMFKLRSMYVNSPDIKSPDGSTYSSDDDPRVTPIGHFLRKTSLDEFPQFLNIFLGDMSFVGPRPKLYNPNNIFESFSEDRRKSYYVKPGITGYAQAYFRNSITQEEKFKWDAYYADNLTFWMDVKIIFKTVATVISRKNINNVPASKQ